MKTDEGTGQLEDRVVVVTGASSGLGEQLARALAAAGAVPVLAARRAERLAELREELPTAADAFARVRDLNLVAPFALACLVAAHMREGGGRSIVNVASVMSLRTVGEIPDAAYVASKAGLIGLTRELASQWGRYGIRVNAVAPGFFASEMTAGLGADADSFPSWLTSQIPLGRGGRAGELDKAILFLLGPGASFITGHVLVVDGGMAVR